MSATPTAAPALTLAEVQQLATWRRLHPLAVRRERVLFEERALRRLDWWRWLYSTGRVEA